MGKDSLRRLWASMALVGMTLLHGCAVVTAPGFDFADARHRSSVTLGQYVAADPDAPPEGVIIPITPALVQAQSQSRARSATLSPDLQNLFGEARPYTIGPSDIIAIIVYDHPELSPVGTTVISQGTDPTGITGAPGFIVDQDGYIYYPYAGKVKVGGLTEAQAAEVITGGIQRVIKDPQVTVRIASFRSRRAYVDGEVRNPGTQIFTDVPMTLPEALNRAGGVAPTGDRSFITLTRGQQTTVVDLMRLQELGVNPNRILLQSGDLVTVRNREDRKVFVMGEIMRPASLLMRNGRLTLNEALAETGGPNLATANTSQIYVVRPNGDGTPALFHLNAANPAALALAEAFSLQARDVVYVDAVPLVQWNRIINLILPSAQAASVGRSVLTP